MPVVTSYMKNLRMLREKRGMLQQEIGEVLGVSQSAYARYERCANELPIKHFVTLCKHYNVSPDFILGLNKEKTDYMQLSNEDITLRFITEDDISDYINWTTADTQWCDWDAPWETDDLSGFLQTQKDMVGITPIIYYKLEIVTDKDRHIGWVSSYKIDGDDEKLSVGIDIPPLDARNKGYGEKALTLYMAYLFNIVGNDTLYTQTWSGNDAMIRLAEKIGFSEIERKHGYREVRGKLYDALTFSISEDTFKSKYPDLFDVE